MLPALILPGDRRRSATGSLDGASRWPPTSRSLSAFSLSGPRRAAGAKLLLLALAIVDDIIAILVIAIFYTDSSLGLAGGGRGRPAGRGRDACCGVSAIARTCWPRSWCGSACWSRASTPTLAGVLLGLLTPARPVRGRHVLEHLEHRLHPVGVPYRARCSRWPTPASTSRRGPRGALADSPHLGGGAGLVVGKTVGIAGTVWIASHGRGRLPAGMTRWHVAGSALAGIGFTVSLFIADLAFSDPRFRPPRSASSLGRSSRASSVACCRA